jgi:replicative DNA helicase
VQPIEKILSEVWNDIDKNYGKPGLSGLRTHFIDLDELTGGFQKSDMIVVAARPSMGKTAFALNIATNVAMKDNIPVMIFSLEMSKESLVKRMLCSEAEIDAHRLASKKLQEYEFAKLGYAANKLSQAKIFIDDSGSLSVVEIQAKARRMKMEHNIQLIVLDYLTLIRGTQRRAENRNMEISEIARSLKTLAKELAIPIVVISQLSRAIEKRSTQMPMLSDLRDSGEVEQIADLVLFVHRDSYYDSSVDPVSNAAQIIIEKHRNGRTGRIDLVFRKELTKFENASREEVPANVMA